MDQLRAGVAGEGRRELERRRMKTRFVVASSLEVVDMT